MTDPFMAFTNLILTWVTCLIFLGACWVESRPGATRNPWVGIRVASTMVSDEAWQVAHGVAWAKAVWMSGVLLPLSLISILFLGIAPVVVPVIEWLCMIGAIVGVIVISVLAARAARVVTAAGAGESALRMSVASA